MGYRSFAKPASLVIWCLLFFAAAFMPALAAASEPETAAEKDETVYVYANADGTITDIEVSTILTNPHDAKDLIDSSNLVGITSEDDRSYVSNGNTITWNADGENVSYKGKATSAVPIGIHASYFLDGQPVSPDELAGKSGKVTIRYEYTNNATSTALVNGSEQWVFTPFTCITALMLDGNNFKNVSVEHAKVINDGDEMIIAGYAMPGLKQSLGSLADDADIPNYFTVSADVTGFELKTTMTIVTAGLMSDFDSDSLGLSNLDDASALSDAMGQLIDGSGKLTEGIDALENGIEKAQQGADGISSGATLLSGGLANLAGDDGIGGLAQAAYGVSDAVNTLGTYMAGIGGQLSQTASSLEPLTSTVPYDNALAIMEAHKDALVAEGALSEEEYSAIIGALEGGSATASAVAEVSSGLAEASGNVKALADQASTIADQTTSLANALSAASDAAAELAAGAETLEEYALQLSGAMPALVNGAQTAAQGSRTLTDGMKTFNDEGVSRLVSTIENDYGGLLDRVKALSDAAKTYTNFGGIAPNTKGSVKFVYELAAIEKE